MSFTDKLRQKAEEMKGAVEEKFGETTGDDRKRAEGAAKRSEAKARQAGEHAKEAGRDVKGAVNR